MERAISDEMSASTQEQGLQPTFSVFGLELCYYPEEDDVLQINTEKSAAELARKCCATYWLSENS